jgi:hypothetical protein
MPDDKDFSDFCDRELSPFDKYFLRKLERPAPGTNEEKLLGDLIDAGMPADQLSLNDWERRQKEPSAIEDWPQPPAPEQEPPARPTEIRPRRPRGIRPDHDGHKRVAEILSDGWEHDLKRTAELLTSPPDGRPGVSPSDFWKKRYNISTYVEAQATIVDSDFIKSVERRLFIGRKLLSETVGKTRQ